MQKRLALCIRAQANIWNSTVNCRPILQTLQIHCKRTDGTIIKLRDILVITDMDNTLLTAAQGIPQCNLASIELFCKRGGRFTVASGRTVESVGHYLDKLTLSVPAITCGGGVLYDYNAKRVLQSFVLPKEVATQALLEIQNAFPHIGIEIMAENGRIYVIRGNQYTYEHTLHEHLHYTVSRLSDIAVGWNKVLFACDNDTLLQIKAFVEKRVYAGVTFLATNTIYFEMMPVGVTKGTALVALCNYLQISRYNTVVIGDYYNDIDLMQAAGYAVAMQNAPPEVKAIANEVTDTCLNGGVGQFLYRLMKQYSE
ncbi:MAG: Cof-type HAD-IIB family hydrolase [Ruthenibacterium sp.]